MKGDFASNSHALISRRSLLATLSLATVAGATLGILGKAEALIAGCEKGLDPKLQYWQHQAALLDPLAWTYKRGRAIKHTVPAGCTHYTTNLIFVKGAVAQNGKPTTFYHRSADLHLAWALPGGLTIQGTEDPQKPTALSYFYICEPEKVIGSQARYYDDPEGLYYKRLQGLRQLMPRVLSVRVEAGQPMTIDPRRDFPNDFDRAIITHVSAEDIAWCVLMRPGNNGGINLVWELSNDHRMRQAHSILVPFQRSVFSSLKVAAANTLGDPSRPAMEGYGTVHYVVLPDDW